MSEYGRHFDETKYLSSFLKDGVLLEDFNNI